VPMVEQQLFQFQYQNLKNFIFNFRNNRYLRYIPTRPKSSSVLCVTVASDRICIVPLFALIVLV
jgi:hypothetical protein